MSWQNREVFLKNWNNYTESKTVDTSEGRNSFLKRVDAYVRATATLRIDRTVDVQSKLEVADETPKVSQKAQEALDRALKAKSNDVSESKMKKIFAAAAIGAVAKLGLLDSKESTGKAALSEAVASEADTAFTTLKAEAQIGSGKLTNLEATDVVVESEIAKLGAKVEKVVEVFVNGVGDVANTWIASQCLPAIIISAPIIRAATKTVGPKLGAWVRKGVEKMAEFAMGQSHSGKDVVYNMAFG